MDQKAVRGIPWTMLSYGANRVITVASTIILARLLVPEDFGLFALATLGINFVSLFSGLGLGNAFVLRQDLDQRGRGTILTLLVVAGVGFAVLLALVAPLAADLFDEPRLDELLAPLAAVLAFTGVNWFYDSVLQKELEFRARFICQVVRTVAYSVVALGLAVAGAGVWSLVAGFAAGHVANGIALLMLTPYRVRFAYDGAAARSVFKTGQGFLVQTAVDFTQQNVDYFTIGYLLAADRLGFYSLAYRQAELPHYAIAEPVTRVTFPSFAKMRHEGQDITRAYLSGLRLVALATFPVAAVLSGAAEPFVETFFGEKWLPMIGVLVVLGIWAAVRPIEFTVGWLLNSLGRAGLAGNASALLLVPLIPALYLAASRGGIITVAWVILAHALVHLAVVAVLAGRVSGTGVRAHTAVLAPLTAAAAAAWGAARGASIGLDGTAPLLELVGATAAGFAAYLAAVRLLVPGLLSDAAAKMRRALS